MKLPKLTMIPHHLRVDCFVCNNVFNKNKGAWYQAANGSQHRICPVCAEGIRKHNEEQEKKKNEVKQ